VELNIVGVLKQFIHIYFYLLNLIVENIFKILCGNSVKRKSFYRTSGKSDIILSLVLKSDIILSLVLKSDIILSLVLKSYIILSVVLKSDISDISSIIPENYLNSRFKQDFNQNVCFS
jgi:hypothetical protein